MGSTKDSVRPDRAPKLTVGVPIRNNERWIGRAIDSVLGQTFGDLELVISDNASTDRTVEICADYAERDPRVRFVQNEQDIGILRNYNRLVALGRGEYFRWLGSDDWLEPEYAAECVAALDANPRCIGVTTYQPHLDDAGNLFYREYRGPRVESDLPHKRFARMLWFLQQEHWLMDPNFSMYRRDVLASTQLLRMMARADRILAAELSLLGPYCHVPRALSNRRRSSETVADVDRKSQVPNLPKFDPSAWNRFKVLLSVVRDGRLPPYASAHSMAAAFLFYLRDVRRAAWQRTRARLSSAARRVGLRRTARGA